MKHVNIFWVSVVLSVAALAGGQTIPCVHSLGTTPCSFQMDVIDSNVVRFEGSGQGAPIQVVEVHTVWHKSSKENIMFTLTCPLTKEAKGHCGQLVEGETRTFTRYGNEPSKGYWVKKNEARFTTMSGDREYEFLITKVTHKPVKETR